MHSDAGEAGFLMQLRALGLIRTGTRKIAIWRQMIDAQAQLRRARLKNDVKIMAMTEYRVERPCFLMQFRAFGLIRAGTIYSGGGIYA